MVERIPTGQELERNREIHLDPERHAVVRNVVDTRGVPIGHDLVGYLLTARAKAHFMGAPGTGKSTFLLQTRDAVTSNAQEQGVPYTSNFVAYEIELDRAERKLGDREEWSKRRWRKDFNQDIFLPAIDRAFAQSPPDVAHTTFIENPGVGNNKVRNRGKTTFRHSAIETSQKDPEDQDSVFIYLVSDPSLQKTTAILRGMIAQAHPTEVVQILEEFHMDTGGLERNAETGIHIKDVVSHMADQTHIRTITEEIRQETANWAYKNPRKHSEYASRIVLPPNFGRDIDIFFQNESQTVGESVEKSIEFYKESARREAAYMEYVMQEELGLSPERAIVAFNPPLVGVKILTRFGI